MKNSLSSKLITFFYGIKDLDEYRLSQINAIGNQLFMITWGYLLVNTIVTLYFLRNNVPGMEVTILFGNLLMILGTLLYIHSRLHKLEISTIEISETSYLKERHKALRNLKLMAVCALIIYHLLDVFLWKEPFWSGIDTISNLINHGFYILIAYFIARHYKLKNLVSLNEKE